MNRLIILLIFSVSFATHAKLIDKVAGVINDKIYTLSEIERIKKTVSIRKEIAPFIFLKDQYSNTEILRLLQNNYIIKDKLSELGFVIGDDAVESRINDTQTNLKLTRAELLSFLQSKGITMNEYFELIKEAMEYNIFQRRIIGPLITITDQEMKNYYFKLNSSSKAVSFKYNVIDYILPESQIQKIDQNNLKEVFEKYRISGNIPSLYSNFSTNDLGSISDEDLPKELSKVLRDTDEQSFSNLYIRDGQIHLFFVTKKELAESQEYLSLKPRIYNMIFQERSTNISANWLSRESINYYILKKI